MKALGVLRSPQANLSSAEQSRLASSKQWDALTKPGFKGYNVDNKAAFNITYDTNLNMFQYWRQVRPDLGQRGAIASAGKGLNHDQYLGLYPWANEPDNSLVVDVGGGVGGATMPIVSKFRHLKLQDEDLTESKDKFLEFIDKNYSATARSDRLSF